MVVTYLLRLCSVVQNVNEGIAALRECARACIDENAVHGTANRCSAGR